MASFITSRMLSARYFPKPTSGAASQRSPQKWRGPSVFVAPCCTIQMKKQLMTSYIIILVKTKTWYTEYGHPSHHGNLSGYVINICWRNSDYPPTTAHMTSWHDQDWPKRHPRGSWLSDSSGRFLVLAWRAAGAVPLRATEKSSGAHLTSRATRKPTKTTRTTRTRLERDIAAELQKRLQLQKRNPLEPKRNVAALHRIS